MRLFMWQTDLVAVAKFLLRILDECLELVYRAGPLDAGQASNQPVCHHGLYTCMRRFIKRERERGVTSVPATSDSTRGATAQG